MRKVVDFHAHAFHDKIAVKAAENLRDYYDIPLAANGKFKYLLKSVEEEGIDKIVIHATATKPAQVEIINDYVAGLTRENIIGFGTLHPDYPDCEKELLRIQSLGLRGLKLHPIFQGFDIDAPCAEKIYRAVGNKMPILMHVGDKNSDATTPERLARVLDRHPELTVVAAHMGGVFEWDKAKEHLLGRKNVYLDTSSAIRFLEPEETVSMIRAHGADRVLFGTDYPLALHKEELLNIDRLDLTEEEKESILWKNAYRLLKL